ncbi:MAG TPA: NAD-dependent succinate-semialdehyde dehydrogenase [Bacteroidales bacterium]|nr:NAD-dependent succinate-semialdehyde dehydrogenase [Bacteroidales bacterium]
MQSINPFNGNLIADYAEMLPDEIDTQLELSGQAFAQWSITSLSERSALLNCLADVLEKHKEQYSRLITNEMGKPLKESRLELAKCVWLCRHYAENGPEYLASSLIHTEARQSKVSFEPLGVLFAIMPWNFPFWQVFRFVVPAILAGNVVILKHAPNVTGCGMAIRDAFAGAGFPARVFNQLIMDVAHTERVIAHAVVQGVTITGSERAGRLVAQLAGKHLKKVVLELGGSDAFIVFPDAELGDACATGMMSRMLNAGQVCIAAKRFLIHESLYESFINQQIELLSTLQPGDPMDESTTIGPMARPDLMVQICEQVKRSVDAGAKLVFGGQAFEHFPATLMPTLVKDVKPGMPLWDEESFGPVLCVTPFSTIEEAIFLANQTRYGLGASIWTADQQLAEHVASRLHVGSVFVNSLVKSDPRLPFGGIKNSGFGRELGEAGIKEFVNIKTYWLQ